MDPMGKGMIYTFSLHDLRWGCQGPVLAWAEVTLGLGKTHWKMSCLVDMIWITCFFVFVDWFVGFLVHWFVCWSVHLFCLVVGFLVGSFFLFVCWFVCWLVRSFCLLVGSFLFVGWVDCFLVDLFGLLIRFLVTPVNHAYTSYMATYTVYDRYIFIKAIYQFILYVQSIHVRSTKSLL